MEENKDYNIVCDTVTIYHPPLNFLSEKDSNRRLRVLSLFSGCGGMDIGMEGGFIAHQKSVGNNLDYIDEYLSPNWVRLKETQFKTVFANDILTETQSAWEAYQYRDITHQSIYRLGSIVDLVNKHEVGLNIFPKDIDVVTGGFPCQDFSVAGKRLGFSSTVSHRGERIKDGYDIEEESEETRGMLYHWMKRVIDIVQPKVFIAENVKGLVNLGDVLEIIRNDFSTAGDSGYIVVPPQVLNAANYGVPQNRERVFFIGLRRDALRPEIARILDGSIIPPKYSPYPFPTHNHTVHEEVLIPPVTVGEVFAHLKEPEETRDPSQRYYSKAKFLKRGQGQIEVNLSGVSMTIRSEHHGNIEFRRLSKENGGLNIEELEMGLVERRLTPRECALIQSFPPDYPFVRYIPNSSSFAVSPSAAYKMIGNAVPPVLAYHFAKRLETLWNIYFK